MGRSAEERAVIESWLRRIEWDGIYAAQEAFRNATPGLKGRALPGPVSLEQIPALAERGRLRLQYFFAWLDVRLAGNEFVCGPHFTIADISAWWPSIFHSSASSLGIDRRDADTLAPAAAISAFMIGDCESEIEMADRAVALNPNSSYAWDCRGWVYRIAGLPEEAVRSFERAMRMSPVDPQLHSALVGMGTAFIELRRFDEAIVAEKKAQRLNLRFAAAYRCLASAFAHLGHDIEAREAAAHLLENDPTFTISGWIAQGGQSNSKLLIEGLQKAGLPE